MGMGHAPASGYVIAFDAFLNGLALDVTSFVHACLDAPPDGIEDYDEFINDELFDRFEIEFEVPGCTGLRAWLFRYRSEDGDRYDDISDGIYVAFNNDDLYEKKLSRFGEYLTRKEIFPEHARWTVYG